MKNHKKFIAMILVLIMLLSNAVVFAGAEGLDTIKESASEQIKGLTESDDSKTVKFVEDSTDDESVNSAKVEVVNPVEETEEPVDDDDESSDTPLLTKWKPNTRTLYAEYGDYINLMTGITNLPRGAKALGDTMFEAYDVGYFSEIIRIKVDRRDTQSVRIEIIVEPREWIYKEREETEVEYENDEDEDEDYDPTPWIDIEETVKPEPKPEPKPKPESKPESIIEKPVEEKLFARAKYINGYPDGTFKPEGRITRAEVAQILTNILFSSDFRAGYYNGDYSDIIGDNWYNTATATATRHGAFKGYDDGTFKPQGNITRAEFVATVVRVFKEGTAVGNSKGLKAGHWATNEVEKAYQLGWLYEYDNKAFNEDEAITREEVVQILNKALKLTPDKNDIDLNQGTMTNFTDVPMTHRNFYEIMAASNIVK